jgi:hypothetical protein
MTAAAAPSNLLSSRPPCVAPNAQRPLIRDKFAQERSAKRFINYVLGIVGAMNTQNTVLFLLLTSFVSGLIWALHSLANTRSLSSFVILCVVTFAIMASAAYAANHMQQGHSQE